MAAALLAVAQLSGCNATASLARGASGWPHEHDTLASPTLTPGTHIRVALGCNVSSGTAHAGDAWSGTVTEYVRHLGEDVIPPGSEVSGVVAAVHSAHPGEPAMLELAIRSIRVNGRDERIAASSAAIIAGSARAHSVCPTTAGAVGSQIVLFDISVIQFTTEQAVAMR